MSRQLKRQQREKEIIWSTLSLLNEQGFLDLKMAEVAKASGCSMGVVYSHFASKEDLLLGCAVEVTRKKTRILVKATSLDLQPALRLALIPILMWEHGDKHKGLYEILPMACLPSVWKRASTSRVDELNAIGSESQNVILPIIDAIFGEDREHADAQKLLAGMVGITMGIYDIKISGFSVMDIPEGVYTAAHPLVENLTKLFQGWGIVLELKESDWQLLRVIACDLITEIDEVLKC